MKKGCWTYGMGCSVLALVCLLAVLGWGLMQVRSMKSGLEDPLPRTMKILGMDEIPEDYTPFFAWSVPFFVDVVVLEHKDSKPRSNSYAPDDPEEEAPKQIGDRGFVFSNIKMGKLKQGEAEAYMKGETSELKTLKAAKVHIDAEETLNRGSFEMNGFSTYFVATRGSLNSETVRTEGLNTVMIFECSERSGFQFGLLFAPDELEADADGNTPIEGTIADTARIRSLVEHFHFCGE